MSGRDFADFHFPPIFGVCRTDNDWQNRWHLENLLNNQFNPIWIGILDTPIWIGGGSILTPPYFPQKCSDWAEIFQTYVKQKFLKKQKFSSK